MSCIDTGAGIFAYARCVRFALLILAASLLGSEAVRADCVRLALPHAKLGAHFVFEATVTKAMALSGGRNIVDLNVGRVWKGEVRRHSKLFYDIETIETQRLEVGRRYVVFAPWFAFLDFTDVRRVGADAPYASCGWGVPLEGLEAELPTLGRPKRAQ